MRTLKGLTFAALKPHANNPTAARRVKLIEHLEQQKALIQNPDLMATKHKWAPNAQGGKDRVEVRKHIRKWWRVDPSGPVTLVVRYGARAIEFEKGKSAIIVPSKDQLTSTIDLVIKAVREGELDEQLASYAKAREIKRPRKAA